MGVKGMTQLIQRYAPTAVRAFDLNSLQGPRTFALDGNLYMQRFHHAKSDSPVPLLWYRLLKQLQGKQITPICVFDGPKSVDYSLARPRLDLIC